MATKIYQRNRLIWLVGAAMSFMMTSVAAAPTATENPRAAYKSIGNSFSVAQANSGAFESFGKELKQAQKGQARAQNNVGLAYMNGKGVKRDYKKPVNGSTRLQRKITCSRSSISASCTQKGGAPKKITSKAKITI
jgi:hypothetical protein